MNIKINSFEDELTDEFYHSLIKIESAVYKSAKDKYDSKPWGISEFKYRLPFKESYSFIIKREDEPIGFSVGYAYRQNWFHISRVAIFNEFQGKGLGNILLSYQLNKMKLAFPDIISVDLCKKNIGAMKLYSSLGFQILSQSELYKYVLIRDRIQNEYIGEHCTHLAMAIINKASLLF